ncbi:hypothetical protein BDC45DRAFT_142797 [Circinella umbellata]|nr:hypothetical protein BDC45DRAFT_142797 [Circinella umbellata]
MSDHKDLYTDDDPEYRNTRTQSGIPPPSLRSLRANNSSNNYPQRHHREQQHHRSSRDNRPLGVPERQAFPERRGVPEQHNVASQQQQRHTPKLDMRVSTDFLECSQEHRLSIEDLPAIIRIREPKEQDYFWNPKDLVEQTNIMRVTYISIFIIII